MARTPRVWFRACRNRWYATLGGKQVMLDGDTLEAARAALERLVAAGGQKDGPTLGDAIRGFVAALERNVEAGAMSPHTLATRRSRLAGCPPGLLARPLATVTMAEMTTWIDRPGQAPTTRGQSRMAVRLAARWAIEAGLIADCPLANARVKVPRAPRRRLMTDDEFARWTGRMPAELKSLARFLRDTGCRPGEARRIEARHLDGEFAVLAEHKTARATGVPRTIPLPGDWPARLAEMAKAHPAGPLFRNSEGNPWCPMALCQAFKRARVRAGLPDHVVGYACRHGAITRWLAGGMPVATAAALAGHANPTLTLSTYSHVVTMHDHLRDQVRKLTG